MNGLETYLIRMIINEGIFSFKTQAGYITLNAMSVLSEKQFRNQVNESKNENEKGATDNDVEFANGEENFVRLSAFDDDKRIDKINMCLRPGSFTTTKDDYLKCKNTMAVPVDRYALPNNDEIKFAFHIKPVKTDSLQRGTVQPANEKTGGGKEVYFADGTSLGTFLEQTPY